MTSSPSNGPVIYTSPNKSEAVTNKIKGLKDALKDKSVADLVELDEALDPKQTIALLKDALKSDLAYMKLNGIKEAVTHSDLIFATSTAKDPKAAFEWLAKEIGIDPNKLNSTGNDTLDLEDAIDNALLPSSSEIEDDLPESDSDEEEEVTQVKSMPAYQIADHLDEDQMDILDIAKSLGSPRDMHDVAFVIAKEVAKENESARKAFEKAEKRKEKGGKMDVLVGSVSSLAARFGQTSNGSGQMEAALDALGLSRKELMLSQNEIEELVRGKLEESFESPEEEHALTSYLENNGKRPLESEEEKDHQIRLRKSVESWALGTDYEKEYVAYLEDGGGQEFKYWADDNVGAITRMFGQLKSFLGGSGVFAFFAPKTADKIGKNKESTLVKEYKESAAVKDFEKTKEIAAAKEMWLDSQGMVDQEKINDMKKESALLAPDAEELFTLIDGKYPDIAPDVYDKTMKEPLREKGPTFKQLLGWTDGKNKAGTDTILLNQAGIDFVKNNEVTYNAKGQLMNGKDEIKDVQSLNGMAESIAKSSEWETDDKEVKKAKENYLKYASLFSVGDGIPLPLRNVEEKNIPALSVEEFKTFTDKNKDLLTILEKTGGDRLIDDVTWKRFADLSEPKFKEMNSITKPDAAKMSPQDKLLTLVSLSTTLSELGVSENRLDSIDDEKDKGAYLMKVNNGELQYYRPTGGGGDKNYEMNTPWEYRDFKAHFSVIDTELKLKGEIQ